MLLVVPCATRRRRGCPQSRTSTGPRACRPSGEHVNPRYHRLIRTFGEATGVPVLLNTSFNLRGEPIVNTPAEAFSTFARSGMDALVMEHVILYKG